MSSRRLGWAVRFYPRRWRQRYGGEVRDLAEELIGSGESTSTRAAGGIVLAAVREHCRAMGRPRRATAVAGGAVVLLAGVLAATTLGAKAPLRAPTGPRQASRATFIAFIAPDASTPGDLSARPRPNWVGASAGEVVPLRGQGAVLCRVQEEVRRRPRPSKRLDPSGDAAFLPVYFGRGGEVGPGCSPACDRAGYLLGGGHFSSTRALRSRNLMRRLLTMGSTIAPAPNAY